MASEGASSKNNYNLELFSKDMFGKNLNNAKISAITFEYASALNMPWMEKILNNI